MPQSIIAGRMKAFPHDLFHHYIIPDILSDYVHNILVKSDTPDWNPFWTLRLVSHSFNESCLELWNNIFGLEEYDESTIQTTLQDCQSNWNLANKHPTRAGPVDYLSAEEFFSESDSLIQVYLCAAFAKSYLNLNVLWPLELERQHAAGELDDAEAEVMDAHFRDVDMDSGNPRLRRFRMGDECMHKVYLPLTCAIQMCDRIQPARLAYLAADYLAEIIPFFSTVPLILKSAQDLEDFVFGEYWPSSMETLFHDIHERLRLIEHTMDQLQEVQHCGKLVRSFKRPSLIPSRVLEETKILQALDLVVTAYWGEGNLHINNHARTVKMKLQSSHG
ncbi:hypothetical protein JB92DRAFT_3063856 [Gautieria morchelliformis]|nr:hypothetical protein JB92DRAFT_3063856 [Gautieria morchelliformis]